MDDRRYLRERIAAALACLQPGIDPVYLIVLSANAAISPSSHGLIVGASQFGMMLGALLYWCFPTRIGRRAATAAAAMGLAIGLLTVAAGTVPMLIGLRGLYGFFMGILYTRGVSTAARSSAGRAFGTVFLMQLLLSSLVAALLPWIAARAGSAIALATLALVPAVILLLVATERRGDAPLPHARAMESGMRRMPAPLAAFTVTAALFLFICATMMIWSRVGALAVAAGCTQEQIGWGVAVGSLSGAAVAVAISYMRQRVPVLIGGWTSAIAMIVPLLPLGQINAITFIILMIAFNVGSTYAIIRTSALAVELNPTGLMRRAASAMHPIGMTAGPLLGFVAIRLNGHAGLVAMAMIAVLGATAALALSRVPGIPSAAPAHG